MFGRLLDPVGARQRGSRRLAIRCDCCWSTLYSNGAMTVTELAERVGRPRGSVAHHVDVLVDAGLLQVVRTRKVRAIEERFDGRTATTYVMSHESGDLPFLDEVLAEIDTTKAAEYPQVTGSTYRKARIPAERAAEFRQRLMSLSLEFVAEPRAGDTEFGMYVLMFPTNRALTAGAAQHTSHKERPQ